MAVPHIYVSLSIVIRDYPLFCIIIHDHPCLSTIILIIHIAYIQCGAPLVMLVGYNASIYQVRHMYHKSLLAWSLYKLAISGVPLDIILPYSIATRLCLNIGLMP